MKTINPSTERESNMSQTKLRNPQVMRLIQTLSRLVTLIFITALVYAIYQSVVNDNPLPVWAWLGMLTLFAVAIGLLVAVIVYRGVAEQVGPFDFRPSSRIVGELKSETRRVEADGADSLRAVIHMTQGNLQLTGGVADIMDADFTYDDADWKPPAVAYAVDADAQGELAVKQLAAHRPAMRQGRSEWVIRLNQDLPTDLDVKFGAGEADLKLGDMMLDRLRVESGVGELKLDLSGEWKRSMQAFIKAGIGDTLLRVPHNAGVRVRSSVGLGSIKPHDLTWDGEAYTNGLYGQTEVNLDITVEGGMGKINLELAD